MTLFQKVWGSSLCCLAFCKWNTLWHLLFIVHLETTTPHFFRESCISPEVISGFFFVSWTVFLTVVAAILVGPPNHALVSTEPLIFYFAIRVWTLLITLTFFYTLFLFSYLFPQILWQFFCFTHDFESKKHQYSSTGVCQESRKSMTFYTHPPITSKQITGEDVYL